MGRTGTFIVIDAMMDMMHLEQKVDVFEFVARIRNQRPQMVQTDVSHPCSGPVLHPTPLPVRSDCAWGQCLGETVLGEVDVM